MENVIKHQTYFFFLAIGSMKSLFMLEALYKQTVKRLELQGLFLTTLSQPCNGSATVFKRTIFPTQRAISESRNLISLEF